jgi:hypothetical protein
VTVSKFNTDATVFVCSTKKCYITKTGVPAHGIAPKAIEEEIEAGSDPLKRTDNRKHGVKHFSIKAHGQSGLRVNEPGKRHAN